MFAQESLSLAQSEELSSSMYWITMVTGVVEIATALSLPLSSPLFSGVSTLIYTTSLLHLNPTRGQLMFTLIFVPSAPSKSLLEW